VLSLLPKIESALASFSPRPHWGKLFAFPAAHFKTIYPMRPKFIYLAKALDPKGKFRNAFLETYL
jgi:xylitol oxidase